MVSTLKAKRLLAASIVVLSLLLMVAVVQAAIASVFVVSETVTSTSITAEICAVDQSNNNDQVWINYDLAPLTPASAVGSKVADLSGTKVVCTQAASPSSTCNIPTPNDNESWNCSVTFANPSDDTVYYRFVGTDPGSANGATVDTETFAFTAIELAAFDAINQNDGSVALQWETAAEIDNVGFNVYRSSGDNFDSTQVVQVNDALVPAQGSLGQGASYSLTDNAVSPGVWYYFLEDIDTSGVATQHDPVMVDTTSPTAVSLSGISGSSQIPFVAVLILLVSLSVLGVALYRRQHA